MDGTIGARTLIAVTAVGISALVGLIYGGSYVLSSFSDCSGEERAILERYPHYGNRRIATYPWTFSCSVRYTTDASRKEVLAYYDDLLDRHGWEIMGYQTRTLVARRDGYSYWISYEPPNREDPDLPNDEALVTVLANDHPPPASSFSK